MAAIDIVGNTVIVTAAASMDAIYNSIEIESANIWWVSTVGDIQVTDVGTGTICLRRFSPDRSALAPFSEYIALEGRYGRLSFSPVTACTLTFNLR